MGKRKEPGSDLHFQLAQSQEIGKIRGDCPQTVVFSLSEAVSGVSR